MKYKAILYDLDVTLVNTVDMNMMTLIRIIHEETGIELTFNDVIPYYSYPGIKVMEMFGFKDPEKVYKRWVRYVNEYEQKASLYPGFKKVLSYFHAHSIKQGIVSSKMHKQYEIDVVPLHVEQFFDGCILQEDTNKHKPDPEPILKCLDILNVKPEEALYIGDTYNDYLASKNANVDFGLAHWSKTYQGDTSEFTYVLEHPEDLLKI